jgi:hypothetical protein
MGNRWWNGPWRNDVGGGELLKSLGCALGKLSAILHKITDAK